MTNAFEQAVSHVMLYEVGGFWNLETPGVRQGAINTTVQRMACGYTNDPNDRGGETKFGISKKANPDLNIATLDWEGAKRIYQKRYWNPADCEAIEAQGKSRLNVIYFDAVVNHGIGRAAKFLQNAVGAVPDGDIGPATLALLAKRDQAAVIAHFSQEREDFCHVIVRTDPTQIKYINGWIARIDAVEHYALYEQVFA